MKRKIVSIVMASAMVFGLAACGSSGGTTTSSSNGGNDASAASETTAKSESSDVVEGGSDAELKRVMGDQTQKALQAPLQR